MSATAPAKTVLHVGCGAYHPERLHPTFRTGEWKEIRLDIDAAVGPDIVASITDLGVVPDASVDAVWSAHNLEHLFSHEVPVALKEFWRVLRPGGFVLITLPDLQQVAAHVAQGRLEETLYQSAAGPIAAIDVFFGHRPPIAKGNHYMAHKTGFTAQTLAQKLADAGFSNVQVHPDAAFALWAVGSK
jgi:ubiquinone/menaquinone biosynthesis C-methylase UbiE